MSVKRYVCFYDTFMEAESQEDVNGEWVKYEDYAALQAEVERLRKAGNALALSVSANWAINSPDDGTEPESVKAWNAAKEGKQS